MIHLMMENCQKKLQLLKNNYKRRENRNKNKNKEKNKYLRRLLKHWSYIIKMRDQNQC